MNTQGKRIIVVLGMHRSGTSAITRGLSVLGVDLGADLYPAAIDNPKGFWEDKDFLVLNERLLKHLKSGYDVLGLPVNLAASFAGDAQMESLLREAADLVRIKLRRMKLYGFKDPRTSRLLPFWKKVFSRVGCVPGFVIAVRNPLSVAASLWVRNAIDSRKAHFLWLEHMVSALIDSIGFPRLVVDFDRFIDDPSRELARIANALGLNMSVEGADASREFSEEFLDGKLRHTRYTDFDLKQDPQVPGNVILLYEMLNGAARDEIQIDGEAFTARLQELRRGFGEFSMAFQYLSQLEDQLRDLGESKSMCERAVADLTQTVIERDGEIAELIRRAAMCDGEIAKFNLAIVDRDQEISELRTCSGMRLGTALLSPLRSLRLLITLRR